MRQMEEVKKAEEGSRRSVRQRRRGTFEGRSRRERIWRGSRIEDRKRGTARNAFHSHSVGTGIALSFFFARGTRAERRASAEGSSSLLSPFLPFFLSFFLFRRVEARLII